MSYSYYCPTCNKISEGYETSYGNLSKEESLETSRLALQTYLDAWPRIQAIWKEVEAIELQYGVASQFTQFYPLAMSGEEWEIDPFRLFLQEHYEHGVEVIEIEDETEEPEEGKVDIETITIQELMKVMGVKL